MDIDKIVKELNTSNDIEKITHDKHNPQIHTQKPKIDTAQFNPVNNVNTNNVPKQILLALSIIAIPIVILFLIGIFSGITGKPLPGLLNSTSRERNMQNPLVPSNNKINFNIGKLRGHYDHDYFFVNGVVTNNGQNAMGVELQIALYDKNGTPLKVSEFWPASIRNIAPGEQYPFEWLENCEPGVETFEVKVINSKEWNN